MVELEIWYVSTSTFLVSENVPFTTKTPLILLMSAFILQKIAFLVKSNTFTQSNSIRAVLEIFQFCFQFS